MTVNYDIGKPRRDKRMRISLIVTSGNTKKRIHTDLLATKGDLNRQGRLQKDSPLYYKVRDMIAEVERKMGMQDTFLTGERPSAAVMVRRMEKATVPTFLEFAEEWLEKADMKGKKNYRSVVNKFKTFLNGYDMPLEDFSYQTFDDFYQYIKDIRTFAQYLNAIRVIYLDAEKRYDIPPYYSFHYKIPRQPAARHRALDVDTIRRIFAYDGKGTRAVLARDCCMLSFCLAATNSADLYTAPPIKGNIFAYDRMKTKDRRTDNAHIEIEIPQQAKALVRKYRDRTHAFCFHRMYFSYVKFNSIINLGLKVIQKKIEEETGQTMEPLTFYAIRHSYATIARNEVGIEKSLIHELLNHIDRDTAIDDVYIRKDFRMINEANRKIVDYVLNRPCSME